MADTHGAKDRPVAFLFTQQTVGLGARKTSMIFLAEALVAKGYDVRVVTVQLSWITRLRRRGKLAGIARNRLNRWYEDEGMRGFLWVPPLHPIGAGNALTRLLTAPLVDLYAAQLPAAILAPLHDAALVMIESCAAVALFRRIRRAAPAARIVYSMSDRLNAVGMNPALQRRLLADAPRYDLVRVPARALRGDLPGARIAYIPHGLDKKAFDGASPSPFRSSPNAVLVGDMMLDRPLLCHLVTAFAHVNFHYFGRTPLDIGTHANLTEWGERPFVELVPFLRHADVGLALYAPMPGLDYLAVSSLKKLQYRYCGLPIVLPAFAADDVGATIAYDPAVADSASDAMKRALRMGRDARGAADVRDWHEVIGAILDETGCERSPATVRDACQARTPDAALA